MFVAFAATATASTLRMAGDATILMNGAELRASCSDDSAAVLYMNASEIMVSEQQSVRVFLHNVPASCSASLLNRPCVTSNPSRPKLFSCHWIFTDGSGATFNSTATGLGASYQVELLVGTSSVLGLETYLDCPVPNLIYYQNFPPSVLTSPGLVSPSLQVSHHGVELPFLGLPGGDVLRIRFDPPKSSCKAWLDAGVTTDGLQLIRPIAGGDSFLAFCDMTTSGGGWTRVENDGALTSSEKTSYRDGTYEQYTETGFNGTCLAMSILVPRQLHDCDCHL